MGLFLFSIPLAILALFFESYPRFLNREYGVDIWTHLLYLKEYHKQKGIPKLIENGFIVPGRYDYPPAFIWILSKFPFRLVERYEFLFSPLFDAAHLIVIFVISYLITGSILIAITTQLIYILTPIIILENSSATPRSLGYTFFTLVMVFWIYYMQSGNLIFVMLSIVFGSLIFLSHRFTTQGFLFFSIIISLLNKNFVLFFVFIVSFIVALLVSRGFYLTVLRGHIGNLKFWKENIKYRFAHQVKGNLSPVNTSDFVFRMYTQFLKFPPFVLQITNPWIVVVFYIYFFEVPKDFMFVQLVIWVMSSYVFALLAIWVPKLRFLGEGQRYLELSAFPSALLSANFLFSKIKRPWSTELIILYLFMGLAALLTIIVIQRKAIIKEKIRTLTPQMKKMFSYLRVYRDKPRLLCIPHQITTNTIYHTGCPVFVNADYLTISKISDVYPFIKKPIKEIMEKNKLDMILLNEEYAKVDELKINYKIIKRIENFLLIKPL